MQKGKTAENIVRKLFLDAGFKVIKYGYEHTVPELAKLEKKIVGKSGMYVRHQPDFVVINKKNEAFFVEVKFRSKAIIPDREIFPYPNCYVVLLTKGSIIAQSTSNLFGKRKTFKQLNEMPPFKNISPKIIEKAVEKIRLKLGDDTLVQQFMGRLIKKYTNVDVVVKPAPQIKVIHDPKKQEWIKIRALPNWASKKMKKHRTHKANGKHYVYKKEGKNFYKRLK